MWTIEIGRVPLIPWMIVNGHIESLPPKNDVHTRNVSILSSKKPQFSVLIVKHSPFIPQHTSLLPHFLMSILSSSPVESLYVEAEEPSLYLHREKLALQYAIRLAANPTNPIFKVTFPPYISQDIIDLYDNKPNAIRSFGLRIAPLLTSANINKEQIETHSVSEIPSWCIRKPRIDLSLHSEKKSESNPHLLKQNFHDLQSYYSDHEHIYTDGSKDEEKVGCAAAKYDDCKKKCESLMALQFSLQRPKLLT